jgi:hypothetical protein
MIVILGLSMIRILRHLRDVRISVGIMGVIRRDESSIISLSRGNMRGSREWGHGPVR